MNNFLIRLFFVGSFLSAFAPTSQAQNKSQLHQQTENPSENYVHARGAEKSNQTAKETYMPNHLFDEGKKIDWLFWWTTSVASIFFAIVTAALFYFIFLNRSSRVKKAFYTHGLSKNNRRASLALDIVAFIALDIVVFVASFYATGLPFGSEFGFIWKKPTGADVVRVEVMPQQWAWNFLYPGSDNKFGTQDDIYTINELKIPKGRDVVFQLKSRDVIHGFWIPAVRIQVDALPGQITTMWFNANRTGNFEIVCAHLCGTNHYKMKAFLEVMENDDYLAWVEESSKWAEVAHDPENAKNYWGWDWGI